jgi:hypothetical protein
MTMNQTMSQNDMAGSFLWWKPRAASLVRAGGPPPHLLRVTYRP